MQLGELILHYKPTGEDNRIRVMWTKDDVTETELMDSKTLIRFQINKDKGKISITGPTLDLIQGENELVLDKIKNFYVSEDGVLNVEM